MDKFNNLPKDFFINTLKSNHSEMVVDTSAIRRSKEMAREVQQQVKERIQREKENNENLKNINEKLDNVWNTLETIVNSIGANAQLTQKELLDIKGLIIEMQKIMISDCEEDTKDIKINNILKEGLKFGGQALSMLMLEYIKYKAKILGFPIQ